MINILMVVSSTIEQRGLEPAESDYQLDVERDAGVPGVFCAHCHSAVCRAAWAKYGPFYCINCGHLEYDHVCRSPVVAVKIEGGECDSSQS